MVENHCSRSYKESGSKLFNADIISGHQQIKLSLLTTLIYFSVARAGATLGALSLLEALIMYICTHCT